MAQRVAWSRRALQDLENIAEYIAADSPTYAGIVVKKIVSETRMLAKFPHSGRKVPEFDDENLRELIVLSYRLIYHLREEGIVIAAVTDGATCHKQLSLPSGAAQISGEAFSLHAVVIRPASAFRGHPGDDLVGILNVAGLAMHAV